MRTIGKFVSASRELVGRNINLTLSIPPENAEELNNLQGIDLDIEVKKYRKKRSLDANAYFHVLLGKIADELKISKPRCKNILLGRYGQREMQDEKTMMISVISSVDMMEREDIHTIPIGYGNVDGKEFTHYAVIRGSHTYDSKEMSVLIDGTVEEAKNLGIETIPPEELTRMIGRWNIGNK